MKHNFLNDYSTGAHPNILQALKKTNSYTEPGYGHDSICQKAKLVLQNHLKNPASDVHFVSGGTQANLICIRSLLQRYESVIAAKSGHIAVHETGAIEAQGHKIHTIATNNGKLTPNNILPLLKEHQNEHLVKPKLVFISNATELGGIYNKQELTNLYTFCKNNDLYLYIDGARLASALTSPLNDVTLHDITQLCDMFYIGGTKNGALLGEAVVINNPKLQSNFRFHLKQCGALLAKGRVLGAQFHALFEKNLYFTLGKTSNNAAQKIISVFKQKNISFLSEPQSNQLFPIIPNNIIATLQQKYSFYVWKKIDTNKSAIRLITSWDTPEKAVSDIIQDINTLL